MLRRVASGSHRPALQVPNDGDWERERGELPSPLFEGLCLASVEWKPIFFGFELRVLKLFTIRLAP